MAFQTINFSDWARREHWAHYSRNVRCTYAMTTDIDISRLKPELKMHNLKLYPALLYMLSTIVNRHEEFRFAFGSNGDPICFDQMHPTYTVFHADDETFSNLWTEYAPRFFDFHEAYLRDMATYGDVHGFNGKPDAPENCFPVSMIPWTHFTGFNLNIYGEGLYLSPIFTFGRYVEGDGRLLLPLSGQFHHAVCDGFHAARLFNEMQSLADDCLEWL